MLVHVKRSIIPSVSLRVRSDDGLGTGAVTGSLVAPLQTLAAHRLQPTPVGIDKTIDTVL